MKSSVWICVLGGVLVVACGSSRSDAPPANDGFTAAPAPTEPQSAPPEPAAAPAPSGPAAPGRPKAIGSVEGDPNALQSIIAGALAGGAATLGALAGGELNVVSEGIRMKAESDAPGMSPDGQLMSARLQAGGHAEASLTLAPGGCYSIVGFGAPGVFDFQINLISAPPEPPHVIAQSATGGPAPTLGAGGECVRPPAGAPMNVTVDLHLIKGQGLVGAQAYKK